MWLARAKLPKRRRNVLPVGQPRRKKIENATNRRMNAIKQPPPAFKEALGGAKVGNVNGVNVIGLAIQGPSVPSIAVLQHSGPYNLQATAEVCVPTVLSSAPLQPRPATTGSIDVLPLQPKYLPTFEREFRSEPREYSPGVQLDVGLNFPASSSVKFYSEGCQANTIEAEISRATVPAMAIGSSTEVLFSIVENQARLRRNSVLVNSKCTEIVKEETPKSPDYETMKSPSTEFTTSTVHSTPQEESSFKLDSNFIENECDIGLCIETDEYTV
ncbi:hypothetical protein NQ317_015778 [Molorchus minor]|uniref:Uncharacterized protein n=1 Tax=Molorchus minor TaxID=1323400 RepID=A0ABQ9K3P1_9CUCU|nr:hypothetical protein NQ317_015778 [Molorchus minor]